MRKESLVFLEDESARRFVAAWASFNPSGDEIQDVRELSRSAMVTPKQAIRYRDSLLRNGLIFPNGMIDEAAAAFINSVAMRKARIPPQKKEKA